MMGRREFIISASSLLLLGFNSKNTSTFEVIAIRIWPSRDYTRIAIEHKKQDLRINTLVLRDPDRLVINLIGKNLSESLKSIITNLKFDDDYLKKIRVGQFDKSTLRLVFELKQPINSRVFSLDPVAHYHNRLVIDLYPITPVDPLLALIQKYELLDEEAGSKSLKNNLLDNNSFENSSYTIAIDPGHGGEDPGAIGKNGTQEKNIVLQISFLLKSELEKAKIKVYMTRDADYFIPLNRRVSRARRVKANLFLSIHADAWIKPDARGSSVYVLSEGGASSSTAKWLAKKENLSDLVGGVQLENEEISLAKTLLDMSTTAQIKDSTSLGRAVLSNISKVNVLHKSDIERAGFAVLKAPDIPSILIETAFISNPYEERRLKNPNYQEKLAKSISQGIFKYMKQNPRI